MPAASLEPVRLEELLTRCGVRDRTSIERHLAACDAEPNPAHGQLWRRIMARLATLAPMPFASSGAQAVMFFIADGKYRMQVFALEDTKDGSIQIYLPDVMAEAVKEKAIAKSGKEFTAGGATFRVESLDAANTLNPPPYFKHMIGWNRKAIRVSLDASTSDGPQVTAVERMCDIAAKNWTK